MRSDALPFHHPAAFWLGCILMSGGVFAHVPMFAMGAQTHYHLAGMPMDATMLLGMALIPIGLALSAYGLMPRLDRLRRAATGAHSPEFHIADRVPLGREHWTLVLAMAVALAVDVMKPATLGFVMPGMVSEYGISRQTGALLALVALTGTTIGSVVWGRMADLIGRRAAILLSALMFIGTSICGAMPTFEWNLAMCFLMGTSAGGLLPIVFTLMAETIPAAHRGWLLVALGGVGTSAGYLLAAGAATLLEPVFSWRSLWLMGLPTGALIIALNRWIPESPRFLASVGLGDAARAVLLRFAGNQPSAITVGAPTGCNDPLSTEPRDAAGLRALLRGRHAPITLGLFVCGVAWGLANFGFLLWLPMTLAHLGVGAASANALLAQSAMLALPGIGVVIWLYQRWSSLKSLLLFIGLTAAALLVFGAMGAMQVQSPIAAMAATVALLVSISGVISMLIPYAAEIYPVRLRGTGSGIIAASSKLGGIIGAGLGVIGFFEHFALSAVTIAVPMIVAALLLLQSGIETRGRRLEEIEKEFGEPGPN
ncbi:MAG: MFS transporter [Dokdonella sp.]|uniref:MFS transporter n=1 Tax=Dokdonella sp. TaxID=2291710 RepID=UPI0032667718